MFGCLHCWALLGISSISRALIPHTVHVQSVLTLSNIAQFEFCYNVYTYQHLSSPSPCSPLNLIFVPQFLHVSISVCLAQSLQPMIRNSLSFDDFFIQIHLPYTTKCQTDRRRTDVPITLWVLPDNLQLGGSPCSWEMALSHCYSFALALKKKAHSQMQAKTRYLFFTMKNVTHCIHTVTNIPRVSSRNKLFASEGRGNGDVEPPLYIRKKVLPLANKACTHEHCNPTGLTRLVQTPCSQFQMFMNTAGLHSRPVRSSPRDFRHSYNETVPQFNIN